MRIMGVDYLPVDPAGGGQMWVTGHGLALLDDLVSLRWFDPDQRDRRWRRLPGSTGSVHQVAMRGEGRCALWVVVKFSRFGQDVALGARSSFIRDVPEHVIDEARFNGPFEEFAAVMRVRGESRRIGLTRLHTKRPLAIYCPPQTYAAWELGRSDSELERCRAAMAAACGPDAPPLHADRDYVLVYSWLGGDDALAMHERGLLSEPDMRQLTRSTSADLRLCGHRSLDHKPSHIILRRRRRGPASDPLLRRHGQYAYGLIDFELLVPEPSDHPAASPPPGPATQSGTATAGWPAR